MMTRMKDGELVTLTAEEEKEQVNFAKEQERVMALRKLECAKAEQKEKLIREKVESMLAREISQIDSAKTEEEVRTVTI